MTVPRSEERKEVSKPRTLCFPTTVNLALDCKRAFGAKIFFERDFILYFI